MIRDAWWNVRTWLIGVIAPEAVEFENDLRDRFGCLLDHATGGLLSKTNYSKGTMYAAVDDYISRCVDEALAEAAKEPVKA